MEATMSQSVMYVGLDVHKDTIAVAVAEDGKRAEVREHGEIANTPAALTKLLGKLGGPGVEASRVFRRRFHLSHAAISRLSVAA
jgi:hypothetical protein